MRIGLVGAGHISVQHLTAWARCTDASVVAICDPDEEKARSRAAQFGIAETFSDLEAMLASVGLDALDIMSPRETHAALVRRAAEAGFPVLCQKPLTDSFVQSEALVREVEGRIRLMVNENTRFRPHFQLIGRWIAEGRLGRVRQVRNSVLNSGYLPQAPGAVPPAIERQPFIRTQQRMLVAEGLIHQLDLLRSLLGPLAVLAARADRLSEWVTGEDMASIFLETEAGAPVVLEGNRAAPGLPPNITDELVIIGSRATLRLVGSRFELLGSEPEQREFEEDDAFQAGFDFAASHFQECIRSGAPFQTSARDNLLTLALVEDTYRMAGRP